jgi:hypothetical protein
MSLDIDSVDHSLTHVGRLARLRELAKQQEAVGDARNTTRRRSIRAEGPLESSCVVDACRSCPSPGRSSCPDVARCCNGSDWIDNFEVVDDSRPGDRATIERDFYDRRALRSRGWSLGEIQDILGEPDRRDRQRYLYDRRRVVEIERSTEWRVRHEECWGRPTLRKRGWTDGMIQTFLGEPDALADNPHYRSGPRRRLYLRARCEAAEATPEWQAARPSAAVRSARAAAALRGAMTKRLTALAWVRDTLLPQFKVSDRVRSDSPAELRRAAIAHHNQRAIGRGSDNLADESSAPDFLDRITANYLRHELTNYDWLLAQLRGRVGRDEAYEEIRDEVETAIDDAIDAAVCDIAG